MSLPAHVLSSIIEGVAVGIHVSTGSRREICAHRIALARLFSLARCCRHLRDLIVPVMVRTVVLASPREFVGWVGQSHVGVSGLLRAGPVRWDAMANGGLPVHTVWLSIHGPDFPITIQPDPDWDTCHHLLQPHNHIEMLGFQSPLFEPLNLRGGFVVHLVPSNLGVKHLKTDGSPGPIQPLVTNYSRLLPHHITGPIPPGQTALLSDEDVRTSWYWIGSYSCMLAAFDLEELESANGTKGQMTAEAGEGLLELYRNQLADEDMLFLGRSRNRALIRSALPSSPVGLEKIRGLRGIFESASVAGTSAECDWVLSGNVPEMEEVEGAPWWERAWRSQPFPSYSLCLPRSVPQLLHKHVCAVVKLRRQMLAGILFLSPQLRYVTLPARSTRGAYAFFDDIGREHKTLSLHLRYRSPGQQEALCARRRVSLSCG